MNQCRLVIPSSGTVDLYDDVDISLTYQIADVKDPQKRHADYSKTITVPGTNNNNKMFQHIFDVGIDRWYDPNKKATCILMKGSSTLMKGFLRIRNIKINSATGLKEYDLEITGRLADLFLSLGDTKITALNFTDLNHVYSQANQIASWSAPKGNNYVYPFIDYGHSPNDLDYKVKDFFPAIYLKELWERIMSYAGFQVSSSTNFFTSSPFKNLIIPFNSDAMRLTNAQIEARRFRSSRVTSNQTIPVILASTTYDYTTILFNNDSTLPNQDTGGVYNTGTGIYTVSNSGYYYLSYNMTIRGKATTSAGVSNSKILFQTIASIVDGSGNVIAPSQVQSINTPCTATGINYSSLNHTFTYTSPAPMFLTAGTTLKVRVGVYGSQIGNPLLTNGDIDILIGATFLNKVNPILSEGDTITFGNVVPQDLKMKDVVNAVIKLFNIHTEYDKDVPNKLLMEPRNVFYSNTVQDWTQKRDLSKELEITPMGALQARRYLFTYKQDKDLLNTSYESQTGEIYGQYRYDVDNDFLVNTEKEEIVFSPSPLDSASANMMGVAGVSYDDRYFTRIVSVDQSGLSQPTSSNVRLLYYGGALSCKAWNFISEVSATSSGCTNYPYAGHLDHPIYPTVDINFGMPKKIFYDPAFDATYTDNNLFNTYWIDEIREVTNKNSSIVTGYFYLTEKDIEIIDFRHKYRFDFQDFRINKIYDFNPVKDGLTKCEFIKISQTAPFTASSGNNTGQGDTPIGDTKSPLRITQIKKNNQLGYGTHAVQNMNIGQNNYIPDSAVNVIVVGNSNSIGENANNVSVINSSGCVVYGDLANVTIINSSGVTVTTPNTYVLNNQVMFSPTSNFSGTYTPATAIVTNLDSVGTATIAQWMRVGNVVTVSGGLIGVDPTTTATLTQFTLTLPIASTFASPGQISGVASVFRTGVLMEVAGISYDAGLNKARITWNCVGVGASDITYTYTYQIL